MTRMRKRFLECANMTIKEAESFGHGLAEQQRDVTFQLGDLARYCEEHMPDTWHQVFPEWISPGLIARAAGVARAYPNEGDRQFTATYSQYMQVAGKPDRLELLAAIVDKGLTTDESRKELPDTGSRPRWLLAVDVNLHLERYWHSGAGVAAAMQVTGWVERLTKRLQEKGLTDVACCFDSPNNFRKKLTAEWEDKYKSRQPKEPELIQQLILVRELLGGHGFCCAALDTFEADDMMASYAKQFDGRVSLMTQDKDLKQCLSDSCNMLLDVKWNEDETSGGMLPDYHWYSAGPGRKLSELRQKRGALPDGHASIPELDKAIEDATHPNLLDDTGLRPEQWAAYQAIMGDTVDGITGVIGIGTKGAVDLILQFGSVAGAIKAAKDGDEGIKQKKREALIAFEVRVDVTRQLVTLRTDLELPTSTRI